MKWIKLLSETAWDLKSKVFAPEPKALAEALAIACQGGDEKRARKLLDQGAKAGESGGLQAWEWAAQTMPDLFVEVASRGGRSSAREEPLAWAAKRGRLDWVEDLLRIQEDESVDAALESAARAGKIDCAKLLWERAGAPSRQKSVVWAIASSDPLCAQAMARPPTDQAGLVVDEWAQAALRRSRPFYWAFAFREVPLAEPIGSLEMLRAVVSQAPHEAMPNALAQLARGDHPLSAQERMEAAQILANEATARAWLAPQMRHVHGGSPVGMALGAGDLELATFLVAQGFAPTKEDGLLRSALSSGQNECAAWALEMERAWPEGLAARCAAAFNALEGHTQPAMAGVLEQMAELCDKRELAVVAVEALSQGNEVVATAVLPLCDMEEVGPLAVGALAAANNEPFGEIARALARSLAQRQALGEQASRASASSKPARL